MDLLNHKNMRQFKVAVIGLGNQNLSDHIPSILDNENCILDSLCDINEDKLKVISSTYKVSGFTNIKELLQLRKPDFAIVAVPHSEYLGIIQQLAQAKVHILKEKPFASSITEAQQIDNSIIGNGVKMQISVQRRFNPVYSTFLQLSRRIGRIYSIEARYTMNIENLSFDWRAKKSLSGGGAIIDMGYHFIDVLIWFFGLPDEIFTRISYSNKEGQTYDVEDTAFINFTYHTTSKKKILGSLILSRVYPEKEETINIIGTKGSIHLKNGVIKIINKQGEVQDEFLKAGKWHLAPNEQLEDFIQLLEDPVKPSPHTQHFQHMAFMEAAYQSSELQQSINPKELIPEELWKN
ncbi:MULTISPECIES: Gfo/Idh/MocA family protein [unclassified Chryseobacterium]|uniref:Gfo/Idh/MocA family protein n=1 Tax=unclassified Chryseobacterium TaxID=2593645 RepID=UPI000D34F4C5|nr:MULTISPECIES: Gfo/Idh/MocA family oxidoreductase [unclassified Chryseobacterium]PTT75237.1 hypothetical protein DBR25_08765 [Chryseobacterium sp. HMWF001]PVV50761.1 gfo/Idh/MocA family oxidoreductase [Chryseobacterium sp. HMWF035]